MAIYISDSNGILKKVAGAGGGSSGESIIVDSVLNSESVNPVQNKVITNALNDYYTKNEVNKLIDDIPETDLSNYYNKSEVDKLIDDIPETDLSNYYNKGEVDNKIDNIPETDLSEYYTKNETDGVINNNVSVKFAESERQKSETDGAIVHENIIIGMNSIELWENPNKQLGFDSQTITLSDNIENFSHLCLEFVSYVPTDGTINCSTLKYFKPVINGDLEVSTGGWDSGAQYFKARALKCVSSNQIKFLDGFQEGKVNNRMIVPMRIYGVKKGV